LKNVTVGPERMVAIVTGGSKGIGAGVVAAYRADGWAVVANAVPIKPSDDADLLTIEGDIADPSTPELIVRAALQRFGRIDTLVNNAGIYIGKPFSAYTEEDYQAVVGVNLTGFFRLTQRVIAAMLTSGGGHIVNISSTLVDYADSSAPSVLASLTKGGIAAATRSLAIEYAHHGIRVNAVSPGVIRTPEHAPEEYDGIATGEPMGQVGQVSDVVRGILFLEASPYITGEIVHIDGGRIAGH
jgi:NAD(P)-dependent dehydrogenase (short-subunit alcohol dehydrogenase family)